MGGRRRVDPAVGGAALAAALAGLDAGQDLDPATLKVAVRHTLEVLAARAPGSSVEVRVPPYGVVQCLAGPRHTRGTPPNVVETDAATWLGLATGRLTWDEARARGLVRASGSRADLSGWLPLAGPTG